ncbi:ligand-binding sensor domain-containing diguanylate cyclase [Inhella gelatinilytica]|uniref:diguanylate cyclase n=1 Tax=Inhella gelatinilytica TaxID=2795030 RepID=A0A931NA80_9BURK|nr:ligand-binding sensor domain-containing diguanylate cyclase [Inhella gelatinilytica]MBH9552183.1 diguanylate cyclase [Inhella gelatinilytica]
MGLRWLLWMVLMVSLPNLGQAQAPQFTSVPVPRGVVASLAQDRTGFLWIGSGNGPLRYDGHTLRPMELQTPERRNLGWIRAFVAGADGRMWMGTEVDGLAVFEPDRNRVRLLGPAKSAPIRALAQDQLGRIWVGTMGDGLSRYDPGQNLFETLPLHGSAGRDGAIFSLLVDRQNRVWIGHGRGLARWDPGSPQARALEALEHSGGVRALLQDPQGRIWLGTGDGRLAWIDERGAVQWLATQRDGDITSLALGPLGELWVGRRQGLDRLDLHDLQWAERLQFQPGLVNGLAGNEITALLRDKDGAIWVGGFGLGLQRHRHSASIQVRGADTDPASPLSRPDIRALAVRHDGEVLAATHRGPVARLNTSLLTTGGFPGLPRGHVEALLEDPQRRIWLAGANQLVLRDSSGQLIRQWQLETGRINTLRWQPDSGLWLATESGLWRLGSLRDDRPQALPLLRPTGSAEVWATEPDGEGGLWVGSVRGLLRWRPGSPHLEAVPSDPQAPLGFGAVLGLLRSPEGTLWLDTPVAGLHRLRGWDTQGRAQFDRISERLGHGGRPFGANLRQDGRGRIWSQSFVYDPQQDRLDTLEAADGARFGTPWFFVHADMGDGRWLFGGSQGLLVVQPNRFEPRREAPQVVLADVSLEGRTLEPDALQNGLDLPPGTRSLSLRFSALDFDDPERLRYRHRLVGHDTDWTESNPGQPTLTYTQLPPGEHRLEVQARLEQGDWSGTPFALTIHQQPNLWQRIEFKGLAVLIALGGAVWLGRWRTRQLRAREALLQSLVEARTTELREASLTDPLTGLHNRRYLTQRIHQDLNLCLRLRQRTHGTPTEADLMVILLDLDHFKRINDRYGHDAGDAVLVQTAERLRQVFRSTDSLVRWGGEEFLIVTRASSRKHTAEVLDRLRSAFHHLPFKLPDGQTLNVTHSAGLAMFPLDPDAPLAWDWDHLLRLVDQCLYEAKASGRDGWVAATDCYGLHPDTLPSHHWMQDPRLSVLRSQPFRPEA